MLSLRRVFLFAMVGAALCAVCALSEPASQGDSAQHLVPVSSPVDADGNAPSSDEQHQRQSKPPRRNAVFEPTHEWREVPRDEDIPAVRCCRALCFSPRVRENGGGRVR